MKFMDESGYIYRDARQVTSGLCTSEYTDKEIKNAILKLESLFVGEIFRIANVPVMRID
jgi:hypothetical protein